MGLLKPPEKLLAEIHACPDRGMFRREITVVWTGEELLQLISLDPKASSLTEMVKTALKVALGKIQAASRVPVSVCNGNGHTATREETPESAPRRRTYSRRTQRQDNPQEEQLSELRESVENFCQEEASKFSLFLLSILDRLTGE